VQPPETGIKTNPNPGGVTVMSHISLHVHIVFATKNRQPLITPDMQERLYDYLGGIFKSEGCVLIAAGGVADHVHLLVSLNAVRPIADLMRAVKAGSSKWVHESFPDKKDFAWQEGYGLFSVSCSNVEAVKKYIAGQEAHHAKVSFRDELISFLKKHNMPYNEKYI
jgi:REP element-mobilizing transposase RayT